MINKMNSSLHIGALIFYMLLAAGAILIVVFIDIEPEPKLEPTKYINTGPSCIWADDSHENASKEDLRTCNMAMSGRLFSGRAFYDCMESLGYHRECY